MNTLCFSSTTQRRRRARPGIRCSNGFALLEALVALLLFSIGILGLLGLQARAISTVDDTEDRNRAALLVDQCASQMQLLANGVIRTGAAPNDIGTVAGACGSSAWQTYVSTPGQGGLSGGVLTPGAPVWPNQFPALESAGGPHLLPVQVSLTLKWNPPHGSGARAQQHTLTTQVTLLVSNK